MIGGLGIYKYDVGSSEVSAPSLLPVGGRVGTLRRFQKLRKDIGHYSADYTAGFQM